MEVGLSKLLFSSEQQDCVLVRRLWRLILFSERSALHHFASVSYLYVDDDI